MRRFRIIVEQRVADDELLRPEDRRDNPSGRYLYAAADEAEALDAFHNQVPIGCLEDFVIAIEPFVEQPTI